MSGERDELEALRRLAELEAKSRGGAAVAAAPAESRAPVIDTAALAATVKDTPKYLKQGLFQTVQGFMDLPVGAVQLGSKLMPQGIEDAVSEYMRERERQYAPLTGKDERPNDIQPGRVGGNVAAGIAMTPDKTPAALLDRMKSGGKTGGLMGLLSPVDPDNPDFWTTKAAQTGVSAAAGFVAPMVIEGVVRAAAGAANFIKSKFSGASNVITGAARPVEVESTLQIELQKNGVDWSKLPQQMRDQLVGEVQNALKSGGKIDADAARRLADFTRLNIKPTQGQVTRDPYQWGNERNLGKTEVGKPIAERLNEQNRQMIQVVDGARSKASTSPDQYAAGEGAISALKQTGNSQKAVVDKAYEAARAQAGGEADVPLQPVAQKLGEVIENYGETRVPGEVMKRLKEFGALDGQQTRVFNLREAEKLKTLIDNNIDAPGTPIAKALGELKRSVDDAIFSGADDAERNLTKWTGGPSLADAAGAFKEARSAASARFTNLDRTPALADVMDKSKRLAPEEFIEQHFIRGKVDSVQSVMKQIPAEGRAEVQAGVIDWIRKSAVLGEGDTAQLSAAGIKKALDTIGDRRLAEIFRGNTEALNDLMALKRVAAYIDRVPKSSGFNTSGSATTLIDALDKAGKLPLIGAFVGKPGDFIRATQVARALERPAPVTPADPLISSGAVERIAPPVGLLGAPSVGAVAPGFFGLQKKVQRNDERRN